MNDMDKDFEQISERLRNFEAQPSAQMWDNISSKLAKPKPNYLVVSVVASAVVLAGFAAMLILAPEKSENRIAKNNAKTEQTDLKPAENKVPKEISVSAEQLSEMPKEISKTASSVTRNEKSENQTFVQSELKPELKSENTAVKSSKSASVISEKQNTVSNPASQAVQEPMEKSKSEEKPSVKGGGELVREVVYTQLLVPNAFTPQGEAPNNVFKPRTDEVKSYRMDIYNRQGLIFTSNDIAVGWDGTYRGEYCQEGVYYYIIRFTDTKDVTHTQKGSLMLLR